MDTMTPVLARLERTSSDLMAAGIDDPQSLANTLRRLIADDKLWREMGAQAIESMELYEPRKVFDFWETLLEECPRRCWPWLARLGPTVRIALLPRRKTDDIDMGSTLLRGIFGGP